MYLSHIFWRNKMNVTHLPLSSFFVVFLSVTFAYHNCSAVWSSHNLVVPVVMFWNYYLISCLSIHKILSDAYFLVPWSFSMTHGHPSGMEALDMWYQCTMTFLYTVDDYSSVLVAMLSKQKTNELGGYPVLGLKHLTQRYVQKVQLCAKIILCLDSNPWPNDTRYDQKLQLFAIAWQITSS